MLTTSEVKALVESLLTRAPTCGTTRVVAIDGPAGSGKTTLAGQVAADVADRDLSCVVQHLDDMYDGWTGLDRALATRVTRQVLAPLAAGDDARWQRYDWHVGRFGRWETFEPPNVLVIEGCGSGASDYADYTTLMVWVEADRLTRIARGVTRDGDRVLPNWLAWMDLEAEHFAANDTFARADVRVTTD